MRFKVSCLICAGASQGFSFWLSFTVARCGARVYGRSASTESFIELDMLTINYSATNTPGDREDLSKPSTCVPALFLFRNPVNHHSIHVSVLTRALVPCRV